MNGSAEATRLSDAHRLRNWFGAYLILWAIGLYATFTSSPDLTPGIYVLLLAIVPYVLCIVYAYRVQKQLNTAGLYKPGAWQVIAGALLLNPFFIGFLIPASVLWTNWRLTRKSQQPRS